MNLHSEKLQSLSSKEKSLGFNFLMTLFPEHPVLVGRDAAILGEPFPAFWRPVWSPSHACAPRLHSLTPLSRRQSLWPSANCLNYIYIPHILLRGYDSCYLSLHMKALKFFFVDRGSTVIKVLCYKSEGRCFDPSLCHWIFHWHKILSIALWPWGRLSL